MRNAIDDCGLQGDYNVFGLCANEAEWLIIALACLVSFVVVVSSIVGILSWYKQRQTREERSND